MKHRFYTNTHEWVEKLDETTVKVGLTDYAQQELGELVFISLPEEGEEVEAGESFAEVESVKAVSNVYSPVTGVIREINETLLEHPELVNEDADKAWFVIIEEVTVYDRLFTMEEYKQIIS